MSDPSVYTHCSGRNIGIKGCCVGVVDGTDEGVEAPQRGRKGMSIMPGRDWADMYPLCLYISGVVHEGSCSEGKACVVIMDIIHARVLRSLH